MQAVAAVNESAADAGVEAARARSLEFLTFVLGEEEYAVDILKVREIRGYDTVTRIPEAPAFIKGVINLRGTIVPVLDLRIKFGLPEPSYDEFTVMIVLNLSERIVGIVVDGVSDVIALEASQIHATPEFGGALDVSHITGLASVDERMLICIDIESLMSAEDMQLIDRSTH